MPQVEARRHLLRRRRQHVRRRALRGHAGRGRRRGVAGGTGRGTHGRETEGECDILNNLR